MRSLHGYYGTRGHSQGAAATNILLTYAEDCTCAFWQDEAGGYERNPYGFWALCTVLRPR